MMTRRALLAGAAAGVALLGVPAALRAAAAPPLSYHTDFNGTEKPLSEKKRWRNRGGSWTMPQKINGVAFGTQTGDNGYDDSYALYYPPNGVGTPDSLAVSARVYMPALPVGTHEVELLLHMTDKAGVAQGYEVNLSYGGEVGIIRWNGAIGDFTGLAGGKYSGGTVKAGDCFSAIVDSKMILAYVNGELVAMASEPGGMTYKHGHVGVGFFYRNNGGLVTDFGLSEFTANSDYPYQIAC